MHPNEELAQRMIEVVWNEGETTVIDEIVAPGYTGYDTLVFEGIEGRDGLRSAVEWYHDVFLSVEKVIETVHVDGSTAVVSYTGVFVPAGGFLGAEEGEYPVRGVAIYTVEDGEISAGTEIWDAYRLLQWTGYLPEDPELL